MEIVFNDVHTNKLKNINFSITNKKIVSIISSAMEYETEFINLFAAKNFEKGQIYIDSELVKIEELQKKSHIVSSDLSNLFFNINIKEDLKYYLENYDNKKLEELLNSFDLDYSILDKCYMEISSSELKKLALIISLTIDKKIIIIEDPTKNLDYKSIQTLKKYL